MGAPYIYIYDISRLRVNNQLTRRHVAQDFNHVKLT